ncbi:FtsX-like permease family protein [Modestobacter sp. Leaf380]|uniref:FtsX-like permease family protein n=1 Tax=Modestobacter sp. Leaf380 TaxID=1736356 RepID=UPI00268E6163
MLLREIVISALSQKVSLFLILLLTASMTGTSLITVGQTAAAEQLVAERLQAAGSRFLTVTDTRAQGLLSPGTLRVTESLSTVESAIGLSLPRDVTAGTLKGGGGSPVALWTLFGDPSKAATLTAGRWPLASEVAVSAPAAATLGLDGPFGFVVSATGAEYAVVGIYESASPFDQIGAGTVTAPDPIFPQDVSTILAVISSAAQVAPTENQILRLVSPPNPADITVQSPSQLAGLEDGVSSDVGSYGRSVLLLVLVAGAMLTGVVVLADTIVRRVDLGRRRALGATRTAIMSLVVLRTVFGGVLGGLMGTTVGVLYGLRTDQAPPVEFILGVYILTVLTSVLAATGPATLAAYRDPVRVIRTP